MSKKPFQVPQTDTITADDLKLFALAKENPNYFSEYLRSEQSGTRWMKTTEPFDPDRYRAWANLYNEWNSAGRPIPLFVYKDITYDVYPDTEGFPVFWHKHGFLFQEWQMRAIQAKQLDKTIIGGYGSGKTALVMYLAILAATTPNFRAFIVAPQMIQAKESYNYIKTTSFGTPFWDRWVVASPERPYPKLELRNSHIDSSSIEWYSLEDNPDKVKTLEGDIVFIDQAELFTDLEAVENSTGSRLRGSVRGRIRRGESWWIANAGVNPYLWGRYDLGETDPKNYYSLTVKSTDNVYVTKTQIEAMKRRLGNDSEAIAQWMEGARPIGKGEHFGPTLLKLSIDENLNKIMDYQTSLPEGDPKKIAGFHTRKFERADVIEWVMPPEMDYSDTRVIRDYMVIGDPGQSNPPYRNSACVMVWDITEFPKSAMVLRAFYWVPGNGSYLPFFHCFGDAVIRYAAHGRNGYDSTGTQAGFNEVVFQELGLDTENINISESYKYKALNSAKLFMARGKMKFPYISHLVSQLNSYVLPDTKIKQDLVMTLIMSAQFAKRYYYMSSSEMEEDEQQAKEEMSRYFTPRQTRY